MLRQNYIQLNTSPNLKGEIGEIIAKRILWYAHRTKDFTFDYFIEKCNFELNEEQRSFLQKYWNTIDLFRLLLENNQVKQIIIFEVKCCNFYTDREKIKHPFMPLTSRTYEMILEAQKLGFITKFVKVTFFENWRIGMTVTDFSMKDFYIHDGGKFAYKASEKKIENNEFNFIANEI